MSPGDIAARALGIEASAISAVEPIKHGLTNESWLVRAGANAVVVRISSRHWQSLQIDRSAESLVLEAVAGAGIGAPVLTCDLVQGVLVTRYLGPTCKPSKLHAPDCIDALGRLFRKLHDLPPVQGVREVHLPTVIGGYLDTLRTLRRDCPQVEPDVSALAMALAEEIAASSKPCLCHNDVHDLNVVDGEPLHLIDWEYAGIGEPFFDLASLCVYHEYSFAEREYLGAEVAPADFDRLAKCCWLFEFVRDLWTQVRSAVDTR
jgi:thiamine kinase